MKKPGGNLSFYLRSVWKCGPQYFVTFFVLTLSMAVLPITQVILPQTLIRDVLSADAAVFLRDFLILGVVTAAAAFCNSFYSIKSSDLFVGLGFKLKEPLQQRSMTMPYACLEDASVLDRLHSAMSSVDRFVSALHTNGTAVLSSAVVFAFFTVLTARLQPWLIVLPLVQILVAIRLEDVAKKYKFSLVDQTSASTRKRDYTFSLMYDYAYGKEVRLFSLKDWITSI